MEARPSPPADVWVDGRVVVRDSTISGRGLFATEDISAGTTVLRLGGRLVDSIELDAMIAATYIDPHLPYVDTITVFEDEHLVMPPGTPAHFGNHSCDPTIWHVDPYELATRRDLRTGDELTLDYATSSGADGFTMACTCGSAICRGRVTSEDWRLPDLGRRYAGHWTPALQQRIDRALLDELPD